MKLAAIRQGTCRTLPFLIIFAVCLVTVELTLQHTGPVTKYTLVTRLQASSQSIFSGPYGVEARGNLSNFRTKLLSHVWQSFDPNVTYLQVCHALSLSHTAVQFKARLHASLKRLVLLLALRGNLLIAKWSYMPVLLILGCQGLVGPAPESLSG